MKYCIVSAGFPPNARGGAEMAAYREAQLLAQAGEEVVVVTLARADEPAFHVTTQGHLRMYRYRPWNSGGYALLHTYGFMRRAVWHLVDAYNLLSAKCFLRVLRQERPDVVIIHGVKGLGYLLPRTAKRFGAKTIYVVHDVQLIEPSGIAEEAVRWTVVRTLWSRWTRMALGSPQAVFFPSAWLARVSLRWRFFPGSDKRIVHNPILETKKSATRPIRTLLFLGQVEAHKGIGALLAAVRDIPKEYTLLVVGDGAAVPSVQNAAIQNGRIRYLGRREGAALAEAWATADLVVVPSTCAENAPTVIQEATAHGIPVLASRVGGIPEFVCDGETGWLVPAGDVSSLRQVIECVLGTMVTPAQQAAMAALVERWSGKEHLKSIRETVGSLS
jgi:glycosyltransferase involved in cell wall biosynthesis